MAVTIKEFIKAKHAADTAAAQYTATGRSVVDSFTATNTTATAATLTVYLVPSGGASGASNTIISARTISPGECYTCPEMVGKGMEAGTYIATVASTAAAITIHASGREIA